MSHANLQVTTAFAYCASKMSNWMSLTLTCFITSYCWLWYISCHLWHQYAFKPTSNWKSKPSWHCWPLRARESKIEEDNMPCISVHFNVASSVIVQTAVQQCLQTIWDNSTRYTFEINSFVPLLTALASHLAVSKLGLVVEVPWYGED